MTQIQNESGSAGRYQHIFEPLTIGGMELKNRTVFTALGIHSKRLVNHDGSYSEDGINYYLERAKGGVGLIVTGAMQVQSMFEISHDDTNIARASQEYIDRMRVLADGVHGYGSKIVIQLTAGSGRTSPPGLASGEPISAGNDMPNVWNPAIKHRALTPEEIQVYIDGFAKGARVVKETGFDGVEIHAIHEGYLLDQFATACFNNRTDEYGGSLENRLRFAKEILQAIKKECGDDFPVLIRYSVRSMLKGFNDGALPGEDYEEWGRDLEESKKAAVMLEEMGYDALDCDNGTYDSWFWPHPPVYMPEACNLEDVKEIKKCVSIPVICAGKMGNPQYAEEAIAAGEIDAVGLGRPLLSDPEWPHKVEAGRYEEVRPCIACHVGCLGHLFQGKDMCCALNPAVCREKQFELKPTEEKKHILVIGGGIAGMEAARVSALRGHTVTLVERTGELGGVFIPASNMSFKKEDKELIDWYRLQMKQLNIRVLFHTEADLPLIERISADEIIVATGSAARHLTGIPGIDGPQVITAVEALMHEKTVGNRVVVIGGGLTGIEVAYDLTLSGKMVEVVEVRDKILDMPSLCAANSQMLRQIIKYYEIPVHTSASVERVEPDCLVCTVNGEELHIPADTVILSVGYTSNQALYHELESRGLPVHLIGDANMVSNLEGAIGSAYELCMNL